MIRALSLLTCALPLALVASSAPAQVDGPLPPGAQLREAQAEAAAAAREERRLLAAAREAGDEAARQNANRLAAAGAITAAEARITEADSRLRYIAAAVAARQSELRAAQAPVTALLSGLALMARRPPVVAIADGGSLDELVRVRVLIASTTPAIRARTAGLAERLARVEQLERAGSAARADLLAGRAALQKRQGEYAALEARALQLAANRGGQALDAGDLSLASSETLQAAREGARAQQSAAANARELLAMAPAPPRPGQGVGNPAPVLPGYRLPADARVVDGLGTVSESGVRSRGVTLATARGWAIVAPAAGIVRFAGPFRGRDGVVIIDHGSGWLSLLINVASTLRPGTRVAAGAPVGRALGAVEVELNANGRRLSPPLIAGSSALLSNPRKGG